MDSSLIREKDYDDEVLLSLEKIKSDVELVFEIPLRVRNDERIIELERSLDVRTISKVGFDVSDNYYCIFGKHENFGSLLNILKVIYSNSCYFSKVR